MKEDGIVRGAWQQALANWSQAFVGVTTLEDPNDLSAAPVLDRIPPPSTRAEVALLKATLLGLGLRLMAALHSREETRVSCSCWQEGSQSLGLLTDPSRSDVLSGFREWLVTFVEIHQVQHPPTIAEKAAHLVRLRAPERMSMTELARRCQCGLRTLQRAFQARFGRSLAEYQKMTRLIAVASQLQEQTKIDALALEVGYRSKKDFYHAFRQVIGSTPGQFRELSQTQQALLLATIRDRLMMRHAGVRL
jgi:AraC-like DNA-binding protein